MNEAPSSLEARLRYERAVEDKEPPEVLAKLWREFIDVLDEEMKEGRKAA